MSSFAPMSLRRERGRPPYPDILTPAEWRVMEAVRHGLTNPRIAQRLGVSTDAVKYHVGNVLQKLGLNSRAELRRWAGVRADSLLKERRPVMAEKRGRTVDTPAIRLGTIVQVARTVRDLQAAKLFYGEALGMELIFDFPPDMAFFSAGDVRLYVHRTDKLQPESILYFQVEDIHSACAQLGARGVRFFNAPHMIYRHPDGTEEWMAEFCDDEGRPLALNERVRAA